MSHDNGKGSQPNGTHTITASKGGGAGKWLAGGLVALLLAGGGYAAWRYYSEPGQPTTQVADNSQTQTASQQPSYAGPLPSDQSTQQPPADAASSPAAPTQVASNTTTHTHRVTHATGPVTEEAVVGVTPASVTDQSEEVIVRPAQRPIWTRSPSASTLTAFYPERALERGHEGEASVHCMVRNSGKMDCVQVSETPLHQGFGEAAVRIAHMFRHAPQRADGAPAPGTPVNLRVVFRMGDDNDRRG